MSNMAVSDSPSRTRNSSGGASGVLDVKCRLEDRPSDDDVDAGLEYQLRSHEDTSWQWILRELEGIRMDDCASAFRKERWLQKVQVHVKCASTIPSAPVANGSSVVLYDLDTEALSAAKGAEENAHIFVRDGIEKLTYLSSCSAASAQDQQPRPPRSSRVSESGSVEVSEAARTVIKRLTKVANGSAVTSQSSVNSLNSNASPTQSVRVVTTGRTWRTEVTRKWAGRARIKVQDFESNRWCIAATQFFTLLLSGFELSQMCNTNSFTVDNDLCLAIHFVEMFGNFLFTLEVFLYIMIYPWKFLLKSYYFWVDVFAVITYYTLAIGGWSSDKDAAVELLAITIPLLRILKITRRSKSWRLLVMALKRSAEPITVPALFLTLVISIGSAFLYWIEKIAPHSDFEEPAFESIPHAIWFSIVTVSTTGYGDVTPHTNLGKLACCLLIGVGVCCFAMPLAVVGNCFCSVWEQRDVILLAEKLKSIFSVAGVTFADLQHLFDATDLDGSGNMELDEFIGFFRMLNLDIGRREIVKFFQMMDVAGTGHVSFDDFREHLGMVQAFDSGQFPKKLGSFVDRYSNASKNAYLQRRESRLSSDEMHSNQKEDFYSHREREINSVRAQL